MYMFAHLSDVGHRGNNTVTEVVGMRACVAHATHPVNGRDGAQQIGKIVRAVGVRVHRLSEEHDFGEPLRDNLSCFPDDILQLATALFAARVRDDAIGAPIVAAALHGDPGFHPFEAARDDVFVVLLKIEISGRKPLAVTCPVQQLRERAVAVGSHHQRHMLCLREQSGPQALRHAASDANNGSGLHESFQFTQPTNDTGLRVLPNGTCVHENYISAVRCVHGRVAMSGEVAVHEFRIGDIHLAAVSLDVDCGAWRCR